MYFGLFSLSQDITVFQPFDIHPFGITGRHWPRSLSAVSTRTILPDGSGFRRTVHRTMTEETGNGCFLF
nr:MAG TPA: hypothetical protein [Caudoviricetes sp.]